MTSARRRSTIRTVYLTTIVALMFSTAAATAATVEGVALLKSEERQKILVEGAKKERKLMFYTALIVDQVVRPVKAAFEKEYPFIQLEFFRANSDRLAQKILAEYQA
jgi:hypothetical protein